MAWLEKKNSGTYHIVFRIGKQKLRRSLKTKCSEEAASRHIRIEENLRLVAAGRLEVPEDADLVTFLLSDGKLNRKINVPKRTQLGKLFEQYKRNLPEDAMEDNSLYTAKIHMHHVAEILPADLQLRDLSTEHLQDYINKRTQQPGRFGRKISATTVRKEIATLQSLWKWASSQGYVQIPLPTVGLKYPKLDEKQPFRTRKEIELEIEIARVSADDQRELWQCLYLRASEISDILAIIRENSCHRYLYPMVALAAYTGARRSELCRSHRKDIQLTQGCILLREKKRSKRKRTFRRIPIADTLSPILSNLLENGIVGQATFQREWPETRRHIKPEVEDGVLPAEAHNHLKQALRETDWNVLPGWHVFRHSFISNCASIGIDQRMIDDWVGHQTDEQRKRYRHLFPDSQKRALDRVF